MLCFTKGDRFGVMWQSRRVLDCHNLAESLACLATCWPKKNGGRNIQRRRNYRTCGKIGHEKRLVAELVTKRRLFLKTLRWVSNKAGDESRTHDSHVGNVMLYHWATPATGRYLYIISEREVKSLRWKSLSFSKIQNGVCINRGSFGGKIRIRNGSILLLDHLWKFSSFVHLT